MSVEVLGHLRRGTLDSLHHGREDLGGLRTELGLLHRAASLTRIYLVNLVRQHDEAVFLDLFVRWLHRPWLALHANVVLDQLSIVDENSSNGVSLSFQDILSVKHVSSSCAENVF